eukprot:m.42437 g.42437  ORF g.42437 m.42437 type:complete len:416 (-) comp10692_c0_seq1:2626-3873(-)
MKLCVVLVLATLAAVAQAAEDDKRVLVLMDNAATKNTHSFFLSFLENNGFSVKYAMADSPSVHLHRFGERLFDHLVLFCPTVNDYGGSVSTEDIVQFVENGGNVFAAGSTASAEPIRKFAEQVGFTMDDTGTSVIDHTNYAQFDRTLVKTTNVLDVDVVTGGKSTNPILFRGTGLAVDTNNELAFVVASASATAYSANPNSKVSSKPKTVGSNTVLVGATQARNNARVIISGSLDMFSNELLFSENTQNEQFAEAVLMWCFQERGALRKGQALHSLVGEATPRQEYTILEEVIYQLPIEEKVNGEWVAYSGKDVQLAFVRMDPFVRATMENKNGVQTYQFQLPDVYGVFQFRVNHNHKGYSAIVDSQQVSVRPLRHTQYERFIVAAYPYYASSFSMMFGVFIFSFVFLFHRERLQ